MSTQNQISIEIPQDVINDVVAKLQDCKNQLEPYLQALTAQERKDFFKMGDKTVATVQKTKSYVDINPEFVPAYMNKAEFLKDEAVVTQLQPIVNLATQLATDADDTICLQVLKRYKALCCIMVRLKKRIIEEFLLPNQFTKT